MENKASSQTVLDEEFFNGILSYSGEVLSIFKEPSVRSRINATDASSNSLLMRLIASRREELAMELLRVKGVDLNIQNDEGQTALMLAVESDSERLLPKLLHLGANQDLKDNKKNTFLSLFVKRLVAMGDKVPSVSPGEIKKLEKDCADKRKKLSNLKNHLAKIKADESKLMVHSRSSEFPLGLIIQPKHSRQSVTLNSVDNHVISPIPPLPDSKGVAEKMLRFVKVFTDNRDTQLDTMRQEIRGQLSRQKKLAFDCLSGSYSLPLATADFNQFLSLEFKPSFALDFIDGKASLAGDEVFRMIVADYNAILSIPFSLEKIIYLIELRYRLCELTEDLDDSDDSDSDYVQIESKSKERQIQLTPQQVVNQLISVRQYNGLFDILTRMISMIPDPLGAELIEKVGEIKADNDIDNDDLLEFAEYLKRKVIVLNDALLVSSLSQTVKNAKKIADKQVIALFGSTGAGKSTMCHFLMDSKFEQVEVEGIQHLRPISDLAALDNFKCSPLMKSETQSIHAIEIRAADKKEGDEGLWLCDTPGFGDTSGPEVDIHNGLALIQSLRQCNLVYPVVLCSRSNLESDRAESFIKLLRVLSTMIDNFEELISNTTFLFSKYNKHNRSQVIPLLKNKKKEIRKDKFMKGLLGIIIKKLSNDCVVDPLCDSADVVFQKIMDAKPINNPNQVFCNFVSQDSLLALSQYAKSTSDVILSSFKNKNFEYMTYKFDKFRQMNEALQIDDFAQQFRQVREQTVGKILSEKANFESKASLFLVGQLSDSDLEEMLDSVQVLLGCSTFINLASEEKQKDSLLQFVTATLHELFDRMTESVISSPSLDFNGYLKLKRFCHFYIKSTYPSDPMVGFLKNNLAYVSVYIKKSIEGLFEQLYDAIDHSRELFVGFISPKKSRSVSNLCQLLIDLSVSIKNCCQTYGQSDLSDFFQQKNNEFGTRAVQKLVLVNEFHSKRVGLKLDMSHADALFDWLGFACWLDFLQRIDELYLFQYKQLPDVIGTLQYNFVNTISAMINSIKDEIKSISADDLHRCLNLSAVAQKYRFFQQFLDQSSFLEPCLNCLKELRHEIESVIRSGQAIVLNEVEAIADESRVSRKSYADNGLDTIKAYFFVLFGRDLFVQLPFLQQSLTEFYVKFLNQVEGYQKQIASQVLALTFDVSNYQNFSKDLLRFIRLLDLNKVRNELFSFDVIHGVDPSKTMIDRQNLASIYKQIVPLYGAINKSMADVVVSLDQRFFDKPKTLIEVCHSLLFGLQFVSDIFNLKSVRQYFGSLSDMLKNQGKRAKQIYYRISHGHGSHPSESELDFFAKYLGSLYHLSQAFSRRNDVFSDHVLEVSGFNNLSVQVNQVYGDWFHESKGCLADIYNLYSQSLQSCKDQNVNNFFLNEIIVMSYLSKLNNIVDRFNFSHLHQEMVVYKDSSRARRIHDLSVFRASHDGPRFTETYQSLFDAFGKLDSVRNILNGYSRDLVLLNDKTKLMFSNISHDHYDEDKLVAACASLFNLNNSRCIISLLDEKIDVDDELCLSKLYCQSRKYFFDQNFKDKQTDQLNLSLLFSFYFSLTKSNDFFREYKADYSSKLLLKKNFVISDLVNDASNKIKRSNQLLIKAIASNDLEFLLKDSCLELIDAFCKYHHDDPVFIRYYNSVVKEIRLKLDVFYRKCLVDAKDGEFAVGDLGQAKSLADRLKSKLPPLVFSTCKDKHALAIKKISEEQFKIDSIMQQCKKNKEFEPLFNYVKQCRFTSQSHAIEGAKDVFLFINDLAEQVNTLVNSGRVFDSLNLIQNQWPNWFDFYYYIKNNPIISYKKDYIPSYGYMGTVSYNLIQRRIEKPMIDLKPIADVMFSVLDKLDQSCSSSLNAFFRFDALQDNERLAMIHKHFNVFEQLMNSDNYSYSRGRKASVSTDGLYSDFFINLFKESKSVSRERLTQASINLCNVYVDDQVRLNELLGGQDVDKIVHHLSLIKQYSDFNSKVISFIKSDRSRVPNNVSKVVNKDFFSYEKTLMLLRTKVQKAKDHCSESIVNNELMLSNDTLGKKKFIKELAMSFVTLGCLENIYVHLDAKEINADRLKLEAKNGLMANIDGIKAQAIKLIPSVLLRSSNASDVNLFSTYFSNLLVFRETFSTLDSPRHLAICSHLAESALSSHGAVKSALKERLIEMTTVLSSISVNDIVSVLIALKVASRGIITFANEINRFIDKFMLSVKQLSNGSRLLAQVSLQLKGELSDDESPYGQQLITEHSVFKNYATELRNEKTLRFTAEDVLKDMLNDRQNDLFDAGFLSFWYQTFQALYWPVVEQGIYGSVGLDGQKSKIIKAVKSIVSGDYQQVYGSFPDVVFDLVPGSSNLVINAEGASSSSSVEKLKVITYLSLVFAYWTLHNSKDLDLDLGFDEKEGEDNKDEEDTKVNSHSSESSNNLNMLSHTITDSDNELSPPLIPGSNAAAHMDKKSAAPSMKNKFLLQPHAAQVLSVLRLLGMDDNSSDKARLDQLMTHHLSQIGTGEGKSITLAVLAVILAAFGYHVDCVCYSEYLSQRDYNDFTYLFAAFGMLEQIKYGTFNSLCENLINDRGDLRAKVGSYFDIKAQSSVTLEHKKRALLIDEVDVFFGKDFYGNTYNPLASIQLELFLDLANHIWINRGNRSNITLSRIQVADEFKALCSAYPDWSSLLLEVAKALIVDVSDFTNPEYVIHEDRIGYYSSHGIDFDMRYRYKTMFAYFDAYDKKKVSLNSKNKHVAMLLNCGSFSYAELPKSYDSIIGVTGTLRSLSPGERNVLSQEYKINKSTYVPSVYGSGDNVLAFAGDSVRDFQLVDEKKHDHQIRKEILERLRFKSDVVRSVMVFFESEARMLAFYESKSGSKLKKQLKNKLRLITKANSDQEKNGLIAQAASLGNATLLSREFGRGTDFRCYDDRLDRHGGLHVLQTFFSDSVSEEIQIKGRTARQGNKGSYSMVITEQSLDRYGLDAKAISRIKRQGKLYTSVNEARNRFFDQEYKENLRHTDVILERHQESMAFAADVLHNRMDKVRLFLEDRNKVALSSGSSISRTVCLMDSTGSMSGLLSKAKNTVSTMFSRARAILEEKGFPSDNFEVQFVAYKNYNAPSDQLLQVSPWESDPANLERFMTGVSASFGIGPNEAVEVAFEHINQMLSDGKVINQAILIADVPPNTRDHVAEKRQYQSNSYWSNTRFAQATYYEDELDKMEKLSDTSIPIHCFHVHTCAQSVFSQIAARTGGQSGALDINSDRGAEQLTQIVTERILDNLGGQDLVEAYREKYVVGHVSRSN